MLRQRYLAFRSGFDRLPETKQGQRCPPSPQVGTRVVRRQLESIADECDPFRDTIAASQLIAEIGPYLGRTRIQLESSLKQRDGRLRSSRPGQHGGAVVNDPDIHGRHRKSPLRIIIGELPVLLWRLTYAEHAPHRAGKSPDSERERY